jgi:hypothetical protein
MRTAANGVWLAGAFAVLMGAALAPVAVADATTEAAVLDLIQSPAVCGQGGGGSQSLPTGEIVMVDGFGAASFKVDTDNPQAQAWFDHGVRLRWAFEHTESVRAFRKARALDPDCGMCAWGEAWAIGPNLNGTGTDAEAARAGLAAAREARRLARDATPKQRGQPPHPLRPRHGSHRAAPSERRHGRRRHRRRLDAEGRRVVG